MLRIQYLHLLSPEGEGGQSDVEENKFAYPCTSKTKASGLSRGPVGKTMGSWYMQQSEGPPLTGTTRDPFTVASELRLEDKNFSRQRLTQWQ